MRHAVASIGGVGANDACFFDVMGRFAMLPSTRPITQTAVSNDEVRRVRTENLQAGQSIKQTRGHGNGNITGITNLLASARVNASFRPSSKGAVEAAEKQGNANRSHRADPAYDTGDFNDREPGNLRVDFVIPSKEMYPTLMNVKSFVPQFRALDALLNFTDIIQLLFDDPKAGWGHSVLKTNQESSSSSQSTSSALPNDISATGRALETETFLGRVLSLGPQRSDFLIAGRDLIAELAKLPSTGARDGHMFCIRCCTPMCIFGR
jgi:hypothetical protein